MVEGFKATTQVADLVPDRARKERFP